MPVQGFVDFLNNFSGSVLTHEIGPKLMKFAKLLACLFISVSDRMT